MFLPKVVAVPEGTQRAGYPKGDTARAGGAPLSSLGRRGRGALLVFTRPSSGGGAGPGPACVCLCAQGVACVGWEWRSPRRGWGRHAFGCRVRALASELRGAPSGGFPPPERRGRPRPVSAESFRSRRQAPRRVSAAQRGVALGRRSLGGRVAGAAVWEPRRPPPPASGPASARCLRPQPGPPPPVPPAAPSARPAAEPARPVRDGVLGPLSRRSARPPRGGRSRHHAAALEWRNPAAPIAAATGLRTEPTRTPGPPAPRRLAPVRARPPGSRSASCASACASSTRSWAPRGTTWAPCASCSR